MLQLPLQGLHVLLLLAGFGQQAGVVTVQLGQLVLFDDQGLLQLPQFQLQLLHLAFVPALLLLALILAGLPVMLQGVPGMLMLLLQRTDLPLAVLQAGILVALRLLQPRHLDFRQLA
ncbi:hypothetical protein D9M68_779720 [compost metagenome]